MRQTGHLMQFDEWRECPHIGLAFTSLHGRLLSFSAKQIERPLPSPHEPQDAVGVEKEAPMALEKQFKLEAAEKPKASSPSAQRRQKFIAAVDKQLDGIPKEDGDSFKSTWVWKSDQGDWFISPRYGKAVLELAQGLNAIKCTDAKDVANNLQKLKVLASEGKLDEVLDAAASAIRSRFGK